MTLEQLERQIGIGYGSLVDAMHQLARRLEPVIPKLIHTYRHSPVRHADETGCAVKDESYYKLLGNWTGNLTAWQLRRKPLHRKAA